ECRRGAVSLERPDGVSARTSREEFSGKRQETVNCTVQDVSARQTRPAAGRQHPSAGQPRRKSAVPPPQTRSLALDGRHLPYVLRVSDRAPALRLVIRPQPGLGAVVPKGAPESRSQEAPAD